MFTQKQMADAFSVTPQAITMALRGAECEEVQIEQTEGRRKVSRLTKTYSTQDAFSIAVKTGKLEEYRALCARYGFEPEAFNVSRKEVEFGKLLREFLPGDVAIIPQYRVGHFRIDFYLPSFGLAIEYDEFHHRHARAIKPDLDRQKQIMADTKMRVLRVEQGREVEGLYAVALAILKQETSSL